MASVDKGALAADPGALQLYPAIPILSSMLDLDLAPAQSIAMNTTVFAALSALGLNSAEGRLEVCKVGRDLRRVRVCVGLGFWCFPFICV